MYAAMKSCYAFGAGSMQSLLDAMGKTAGDRYVNYNYRAALLGQASMEMIQLMELLGDKPATPIGSPGVGDCFVTSTGGHNMRYGRLIGLGVAFGQARAQMPGVILEGATTIAVVGRAMVHLTKRGIIPPERFPPLCHLYEVVGLD